MKFVLACVHNSACHTECCHGTTVAAAAAAAAAEEEKVVSTALGTGSWYSGVKLKSCLI